MPTLLIVKLFFENCIYRTKNPNEMLTSLVEMPGVLRDIKKKRLPKMEASPVW